MDFRTELEARFSDFFSLVSTDKKDWTVKGFIDVYKNIYTISVDTKVVSKIVELMIFPVILQFAKAHDLEIVLASHQNHYPDVTFIERATGAKIALDLKSTYRITDGKVNGMTLGAFTGYFRNRSSTKNISFPYQDYRTHYILGIIYSRADLFNAVECVKSHGFPLTNRGRKALGLYIANQSEKAFAALTRTLSPEFPEGKKEELRALIDGCLIDEKKRYTLDDLPGIMSVVRDFDFFVQEKWKIASDRPGSGNTKNIGSTTSIEALKQGTGLFTRQTNGEQVFNDYWMYYLTKDMARAIDSAPPYRNIKSYFEYKGLASG